MNIRKATKNNLTKDNIMLKIQKEKKLTKHLMMLHFQNNIIHFTFTKMLYFDENTVEARKEYMKMKASEKCNYCKSIPLRYLLITYNCLHLCHMAKNMAMMKR